MPILSELSRKFHMLTTDAKPDPPRVDIGRHTLLSEDNSTIEEAAAKRKSKSIPNTPDKEYSDVSSVEQRRASVANDAIPIKPEFEREDTNIGEQARSSTSESKEHRKPNVRTRTKSKQSKYSHGTNIVNYNIINSNGVKIGSRTNYICNVNRYSTSNGSQTTATSDKKTSSTKPKRPMPETVDSLSMCKEEISLDDMFVVKTHLGQGWKKLAKELSYSDGQIEQFEENYKHRGIDEVIYQLLLDWKQTNTKDAQIGILTCALWCCQEYECAERLATARKNSSEHHIRV